MNSKLSTSSFIFRLVGGTMVGMKFDVSSNAIEKTSSDAVIVFAMQESSTEKQEKGTQFIPTKGFITLDTLVRKGLTRVATLEKFTGKRGEVITFVGDESFLPTRVYVLGLGKRDTFVADDIRRAVGSLIKRVNKKLDSLSILLPTEDEGPSNLALTAQCVVEGLQLGAYTFMQYKKKEKGERELSSIIFIESNPQKIKDIKTGIQIGELYAQATIVARDLINETPTIATPTYLSDFAKEIAKGSPEITCHVFDKPQLEKMGMHAFLGIARASDTPPKFIHLEYTPAKKSSKDPLSHKASEGQEKLALVGKGITFDSGGINVKPGDYMQDMKCDMSGAALVLGVFSVIAKVKPSFPVIGLIAATPNLISSTSIVPGDVVRAMNGKTIEVLNTDAEGRVTMADSLSYAVKEGATSILDFATLTGACVVALGDDIAGLFSNNKDLTTKIESAASDAGEKVWELPLEGDYKEMNKSSIADVANIGSSRYGGAIHAALFLQEFVSEKPWAHLDIAGPAYLAKPSDIGPKGATGFGVRTVLNLLRSK